MRHLIVIRIEAYIRLYNYRLARMCVQILESLNEALILTYFLVLKLVYLISSERPSH